MHWNWNECIYYVSDLSYTIDTGTLTTLDFYYWSLWWLAAHGTWDKNPAPSFSVEQFRLKPKYNPSRDYNRIEEFIRPGLGYFLAPYPPRSERKGIKVTELDIYVSSPLTSLI